MSPRRGNELGDPAWDALHDRVAEMARADVAEGRDPQVMCGELATFEDVYQEAYLAALLEKQLSSN